MPWCVRLNRQTLTGRARILLTTNISETGTVLVSGVKTNTLSGTLSVSRAALRLNIRFITSLLVLARTTACTGFA